MRGEESDTVRADLEALAEATAAAAPPARLEQLLRSAVRERAAARRGVPRWVAVGLAASLAGILLLTVLQLRGSTPAPAALASDFIPLDRGDLTDADSLLVVRVQLTEAMLAGLGWSAGADLDPNSMEAEVVLGHDGVARAIRFVE
jgi:hypothetical protein